MTATATGFDPDASIRLDKWLWAARFFKTRRLAVEAINGGKVQVNGRRTKPGKSVQAGARLIVHKGSLEWDLTIKGISKQRRPASEAALLFEESENSRLFSLSSNRRAAYLKRARTAGCAARSWCVSGARAATGCRTPKAGQTNATGG